MIVWTDRDMLFSPHDLVKHSNGSTYCILLHCLREADRVACYAYRDVAGGPVWIRPAGEMEDGRFTLLKRAEPETAEPDDQADLIVLMSGLLREAIDANNQDDTVAHGWYRRAANALSRCQDTPAMPTHTGATPKSADAPTGRSGALSRQVDGDHYHRAGIQPWDVIDAYALDFYEGNALKYLLRRKPGVDRVTDLKKAAHYIERCIERAAAVTVSSEGA